MNVDVVSEFVALACAKHALQLWQESYEKAVADYGNLARVRGSTASGYSAMALSQIEDRLNYYAKGREK